jgi:D-alanyl-D-alanine dipeptidase
MVDELATGEIADICVAAQAEIAQVPIHESREPLVNLPTHASRSGVVMTFSDVPYPDMSGPGFAGKPQLFWARQSFAERLILMARILAPLGIVLHVEEAFRPYEVQSGMFWRRLARTRSEHPSWTDEQLMAEARSKTASIPRLASHMAGAAVDVFLRDAISGELLDFGHRYPDGGAVVHPASPFVTSEQWKNRQTLEVAAQLAGLAVYVGEDWHVSYGDNLWAWQTGAEAAVYGAVKEFSLKTGVITSEFVGDELDQQFFS